MVKSLEEYVAEATNAYQPAKTAVQQQIDALAGQQDTTYNQINKNYANQQAGLNRQRNMAAESASMQAAGSGGSFGGAANIANRKYYDQSFIPAQTQLQTNQANELAQARQSYENRRTDLNSQLSNLDAQAEQMALQQYWAAVEAEKEREAQERAARISAAAASSPYAYLDDGYSNSNVNKANVDYLTWVKNYSNYDNGTKNSIINGFNSLTKQWGNKTGLLANTINNAYNSALQNSSSYKQYLKWRNS